MRVPICTDCNMADGRHTSDCPVRLAARGKVKEGTAAIVADLAKWRSDPDVKLIIHATLRRHEVENMSQLPVEVLTDMHEAIATMLDEAPTFTTLGDPRRMT
jgi:hypothetical protein